MASVQEKAKAAAWQALRGRNPLSPVSAEERTMIGVIVQGVVDAESAQLEQEQRRCGDAGALAELQLKTLQLSEEARCFLDEILNGKRRVSP